MRKTTTKNTRAPKADTVTAELLKVKAGEKVARRVKSVHLEFHTPAQLVKAAQRALFPGRRLKDISMLIGRLSSDERPTDLHIHCTTTRAWIRIQLPRRYEMQCAAYLMGFGRMMAMVSASLSARDGGDGEELPVPTLPEALVAQMTAGRAQ